MEYSFHRLAELIPMCGEEDRKNLEEDIRKNGLVEPITLHIGMILDGRNRYFACKKVGVTPRFIVYQGDNPLEFVLSKNISRRHLTDSQRAAVAGKIANMLQGVKQEIEYPLADPPIGESGTSFNKEKKEVSAETLPPLVSIKEAAGLMHVSERSVERARKVINEGLPPLVELVEDNKVSLSLASRVAKEPRVVQGEFISRVERGEKPPEVYRSTVMHAGYSDTRNEIASRVMHKGYEDAKPPETRQVFCPYCNKGFKVPE